MSVTDPARDVRASGPSGSDEPAVEWSTSRNRWTVVTLVLLVGFALVGAFYALDGSQQAGFVSVVAIAVSLVLAGLAWTETRRNVGLVVAGGLAATAFFVGNTLLVGPSVGSVAGEVIYDLVYLLAPVSAAMSYRRLASTPERPTS